MLNIIPETKKKVFCKNFFCREYRIYPKSATAIILKFFTIKMRRLLKGATYLMVAFIWKLDVTKKGINFGITIFCSRLTEF